MSEMLEEVQHYKSLLILVNFILTLYSNSYLYIYIYKKEIKQYFQHCVFFKLSDRPHGAVIPHIFAIGLFV